MDTIDRRILENLRKDASLSAQKLTEDIHLSVPAINKRIQRMENTGIISKFTVITDRKAVGKEILACMLVQTEDAPESERLMKMIREDEDILECYAVTGNYDYILKICAKDIDSLEKKLLLLRQNGVSRSETLMCLKEYKMEAGVLPGKEEE